MAAAGSDPAPVVVLRLPERLETENLPEFQDAVRMLLEEGRVLLAVDASQVLALRDNGWFGFLIWSFEMVRERGGDLRMFAPSREITRLLELFGLDEAFPVYGTEAEAVASFPT